MASEKTAYVEHNKRQHLFVKYTFAILVDLTVLNLFAEFWSDHVYLQSFSISLMVAILLQLLLQVTLKVEHRVADYFKQKSGLLAKGLRILSTWAILFVSKLVILKAIDLVFSDAITFTGRMHGVVPFIVVIIAIILAEQSIMQINRMLRDKD